MSWTGKLRQEWAQAVRAAHGLSMTARLVGQALALDFANRDTGQCNPSRKKLAEHLGVHESTIKRALAELVNGGWLSKTTATARNRTAQHTFLIPGKSRGEVVKFPTEKASNAGQKRPAIDGGTGGKSEPNAGQICTAPYKGRNQVLNQGVREADRQEARNFVAWVEGGGDLSMLDAAARRSAERLMRVATAEGIIGTAWAERYRLDDWCSEVGVQ